MCLRRHAVDQAPQLFDYSLYELLFVPVILPELREDIVLLTGVLHPGRKETVSKRQVKHSYPLKEALSCCYLALMCLTPVTLKTDHHYQLLNALASIVII